MNSQTIREKYLEDYPIPITAEGTEIILNQMKKCICKIYMDNGSKGTGFFCKVPFPDKEHLVSFLITNNHIIDESYLKKDKRIDFTINNDRIEKKLIIGNRKVYTSYLYDTTFIELFENKDGIKDFLELDFLINEEFFNNKYINKSIYALQYPNNERISVSYGTIRAIDLIDNHNITHLCSTDKGSSGSPLLNVLTNKLIAIHRGSHSNHNFNKGTLLYYPLRDFISKIKKKSAPKKMILNSRFKKLMIDKISLPENTEKRIIKEYKDILESGIEGFQIFGLIEQSIFGILEGPPDTIYENGFFLFMIKYTNDYPFKPPKFYFQTKIFHPNIDELGNVSVDILQYDNWNPLLSLGKIILSVQSLLDDPNPDIFVNENAAKLYKENKTEYENTVRKYTSEYANFKIIQTELKKANFKMELGN